jgi:hypothetical protein
MSLALLHSPAKILRELLIDLSAGTGITDEEDWPIYVSSEPDLPDNCLTIYDTTPKSDGRAMFDGEDFKHYGFQIRIRSTDHETGYAKAESLEHVLNKDIYQETVVVGAVSYYVQCVAGTSLIVLGKNTPTTKRSLFTINGLISLTREV